MSAIVASWKSGEVFRAAFWMVFLDAVALGCILWACGLLFGILPPPPTRIIAAAALVGASRPFLAGGRRERGRYLRAKGSA